MARAPAGRASPRGEKARAFASSMFVEGRRCRDGHRRLGGVSHPADSAGAALRPGSHFPQLLDDFHSCKPKAGETAQKPDTERRQPEPDGPAWVDGNGGGDRRDRACPADSRGLARRERRRRPVNEINQRMMHFCRSFRAPAGCGGRLEVHRQAASQSAMWDCCRHLSRHRSCTAMRRRELSSPSTSG